MLRPHQERAVDALRDCYRRNVRAAVLVLPTGAGKTRVAAHIIRGFVSAQKRAVFVVHRIELVRQARDAIASQLDAPIRILAGEESEGPIDAPVVVASAQTLLARRERPIADLAIFDEAHHYASDEWCALVRHYRDASKFIVGLTATPERGDGRPMGDLFDELIAPTSIKELTAAGYLVPCLTVAPTEALRNRTIAKAPHDALLEHRARWSRAVIFAGTVAHAEKVCTGLIDAGFRAEVVHGELASDARADILRRFRACELDCVVNVFVLTEGFDDPAIDCVVLARGCGHAGTYLQIAGRALRPAPGKTQALFLDLAGAVHDHGLIDADRTYALDGEAISAKNKAATVSQCRACGAAFERGGARNCPVCGAELAEEKPVTVANRDLVAIKRAMAAHSEDKRLATWRSLLSTARERGYKLGWAYYQYSIRYSGKPPVGA